MSTPGREELLQSLFPTEIPEDYKNNEIVADYLDKLGAKSINDIDNELVVLKEEKSNLINQAKEAACTNYKTFIETHQCSNKIFHNLCLAEDKLTSLTDSLPEVVMTCSNISERLNDIKTERKTNYYLLKYNSQILQFLKLPQLMLNSIQQSSYEDAFQIVVYVKNLADKYSSIAVIKEVEKNVDKYWWEMKDHLLDQLHTDIQLSKCLQVMGYLRRMNVFTEVELRLQFLQARDSWFTKLLQAIPSEDYNHHLGKTIELSRVNIFNIVTQYKAVFTEDEVIGRQDDPKSSFFHMWLSRNINDFLRTVELDLPYCSPNSLDSLYGQCMYFGLSSGRIGADFRAIVQSYFTKTVVDNFKAALNDADTMLENDMDNFNLPKDDSITNMISTLNLDTESAVQDNPPLALLEFQPMALYCNNVLSAFNNLRLCVSWNILIEITDILRSSLKNSSLILLKYYKREKHTFSTADRETFGRLCETFAKLFLPFMQNCLHAVFKPSEVASHYGLSLPELERQGIGYLDTAKILNAINDILLTLQVVADSVV